MPDFVPDITEKAVITALRTWLLSILTDVEVIRVQVNRAPMPKSDNWIGLSPTGRTQLSTTSHTYHPDIDKKDVARSTSIAIQMDVYGPDSTDIAQTITTLFRDAYGTENMTVAVPLYCDDGHQMPLVNGEEQYEQRWMIQAMLQANPTIVTPQQFADSVDATLVEADR
jgi:hypothetical protein